MCNLIKQSLMGRIFFSLLIGGMILLSCSQSNPTKTIENLKTAITGESNTRAKYIEFSKKAYEEGYLNIGKMFEAISNAETVHIANHRKELEKFGITDFEPVIDEVVVESTLENLVTAKAGEVYEFSEMYPKFMRVADEEKVSEVKRTFDLAAKAEARHADYYQEAYVFLASNNNDSAFYSVWYVCPHCGDTYTESNKPEQNCDLGGNIVIEKFMIFQ